MTLNQLKWKVKHLNYLIGYWLNLEGYRGSGLKLVKPDSRNYKRADMFVGGLFGYTPKEVRKLLPGISSAWNQGGTYCCQWYATAKAKEIYEKVALSVKSLVSWGKANGLTAENGLSNMNAGEKGLKNWGIMEEADMPSKPYFSDLSSGDVRSVENSVKADKHRSSSYVQMNSIDEVYEMLDEGKPVKIGIPWYSGFNARSGRSNHWLIDGIYGIKQGGHCIWICGYDTDLYGLRGFYYQNSYGSDWGKTFTIGDNSVDGAGFITEKQLKNLGSYYGFFTNFDVASTLDLDYKQILQQFDGLNVRGNKSGAIYRIIGAMGKATYTSPEAFLSINGFPYTKPNSFTIVRQEELDKIPYFADGILTGETGQWKEITDSLKKPVNNNFNY